MLKTRWPWLLLAAVLSVALGLWIGSAAESPDRRLAETKMRQIVEGLRMTSDAAVALVGPPTRIDVEDEQHEMWVWEIGYYSIHARMLREDGQPLKVWYTNFTRPTSNWDRLRRWLRL